MKNEVIGDYRGVPIKKYNIIFVRVSQFEFKKFIDARLDCGLSTREALENYKDILKKKHNG